MYCANKIPGETDEQGHRRSRDTLLAAAIRFPELSHEELQKVANFAFVMPALLARWAAFPQHKPAAKAALP